MAQKIELVLALSADQARKQVADLANAVKEIGKTKVDLGKPESLGQAVAEVKKLATGYSEARTAIAATVDEQKRVAAALALSGDTTSSAYKSAIAEIKKSSDELKKMDAALDEVNKSAGETPKKFAGFVEFQALKQTVVDVAGAFQQFTTPFIEFDKQLKNIGTLGVKNFDDFRNAAIDLASSVPDTVAGVTEGIYNAISAGAIKVVDGQADVAEGMKFVETASRLAVAGLTSTNDAIKSLASVTNAYGTDVLSVGEASDFLFATVKNGVTTVPELNAALSNIVPIAAAAGVGFDQVSGAIATLTKQGTPTAQATTQIRQAISELLSPGAKLEKVMKAAGVSVESLKTDGLAVSLEKVRKAAEATGTSVFEAFGSIESKQAVLALTGANAQKAADDLLAIQQSVGSVDEAFSLANQGIGVQVQGILNGIEAVAFKAFGAVGDGAVVAIEAVNKLAPVVGSLSGIQALLPKDAFAKLSDSAKSASAKIVDTFTKTAADGSKAFVGIAGSISTVTSGINQQLLGAVQKVAPALVSANAAGSLSFVGLRTAAASAWVAITGPIGLVVAGVVALGVAVVAAYKYWDDFRVTVDAVWDAISSLAADVVPLLKEIGGVIVASVKLPFELIASVVSGIGSLIGQWLGPTKQSGEELFSVKNILDTVRGVIDTIRASIAGVQQAFGAIKSTVSGAFDSLIKGDVAGAFKAVSNGAKETEGVFANFGEGFDLKKLQISFDREFAKLPDIAQKYTARIKELQKDGFTLEEVKIGEGVLQRQLEAELSAADKLTKQLQSNFGLAGKSVVEASALIAKMPRAQKEAFDAQSKQIDQFRASARDKYQLQLSELKKSAEKSPVEPPVKPKVDAPSVKKASDGIAKFAAETKKVIDASARMEFSIKQDTLKAALSLVQSNVSSVSTLESSLSLSVEFNKQQLAEQVRVIEQRTSESLASASAELKKLADAGEITQAQQSQLLAERRIALEKSAELEIGKIKADNARQSAEQQLALEEKLVIDLTKIGQIEVAEAKARLTAVADERKKSAAELLTLAGQTEQVVGQVLSNIDKQTAGTIQNLTLNEQQRLESLSVVRAQYAAQVEAGINRELDLRTAQFDAETTKQRDELAKNLEALRANEEEKSAILEEFEKRRQDARLAIISTAAEDELALTAQTLGQLAGLFKENTLAFKALAIAEATISAYLAFSKSLAQGGFLGIAQAAIALATGLANVAKIAGVGFKKGGFTPNVGKDEVAGVVHGKEFVANAELTEQYRDFFADLHATGDLGYAIAKNTSRIATSKQLSNLVVDSSGEIKAVRSAINKQTEQMVEMLTQVVQSADTSRLRPVVVQNHVRASVPAPIVNFQFRKVY